jgi:hypothetical protein
MLQCTLTQQNKQTKKKELHKGSNSLYVLNKGEKKPEINNFFTTSPCYYAQSCLNMPSCWSSGASGRAPALQT